MSVTSTGFRDSHRILFSAPIGKVKGIPAEVSGERVLLFDNTTVIDLNGNGKPDMEVRESFNRVVMRLTEPSFVTSYDSIVRLAAREKTDVLTQDDVRSVEVQEFGYDLGKWVWSSDHKLIQENRRRLESVVDEAGVLEPDARWAIDVAQGEFLVFAPK